MGGINPCWDKDYEHKSQNHKVGRFPCSYVYQKIWRSSAPVWFVFAAFYSPCARKLRL